MTKVVSFQDRNGENFHTEFQQWRQEHENGFFLNFKRANRAKVHASTCHHSGDSEWTGDDPTDKSTFQTSLTAHRKVCSTDLMELLKWAAIEEVQSTACRDCIQYPLPNLPKQKMTGPIDPVKPLKSVNRSELEKQAAAKMANSAWAAVGQSGKHSTLIAKDKKGLFQAKHELNLYVLEMLKAQKGICALTGLSMVLHPMIGDPDLRYSLDRIDSTGRYESGNLQIVCWFANRWKGTSENDKFQQLIRYVRSVNPS